MTHPVTPPPELVQQWGHDANLSGVTHNDEHWAYEQHIATHAAQWGADQELEACCEYVYERLKVTTVAHIDIDFELLHARRPKPPSLKAQALEALREAESSGCLYVNGRSDTIRRALEALPE